MSMEPRAAPLLSPRLVSLQSQAQSFHFCKYFYGVELLGLCASLFLDGEMEIKAIIC